MKLFTFFINASSKKPVRRTHKQAIGKLVKELSKKNYSSVLGFAQGAKNSRTIKVLFEPCKEFQVLCKKLHDTIQEQNIGFHSITLAVKRHTPVSTSTCGISVDGAVSSSTLASSFIKSRESYKDTCRRFDL